MRHRLALAAAVAVLFAVVLGGALFPSRSFGHRDAGAFHYPTLGLVKSEWDAGRWPLWNVHENGGTPLLANPACAALYPVRILVFQWTGLPFPLAYKLYILLHVIGAAAAAYALGRHGGADRAGSTVGALAYAFGAPVLFQVTNVIFLVGAAWLPLGLVAADRALRLGQARWSAVLGSVLALQVLGGDPESAAVTALAAALHAALLDRFVAAAIVAALAAGRALTLLDRPQLAAVAAAVCVASILVALRRRPRHAWIRARNLLAALGGAAALALLLAAAQWMPALEFARLSVRAAPDGPHDPYGFSVVPWRLAEMAWPNVGGREFPLNTRWMGPLGGALEAALPSADAAEGRAARWTDALLPRGESGRRFEERLWEPSLYAGILPLILALAAWRVRRASPWRRWLSLLLAGGIAGSLGRLGLLYPLLDAVVPGFGVFRYPSKLLTLSCAAMAGLAAVGLTSALRRPRRFERAIAAAAGISLGAAAAAVVLRSPLLDAFHAWSVAWRRSLYGPLLPDGAWRDLAAAPLQAFAVLAVSWLLLRRARASPWKGWRVVALAAVVSADLGLANRWMVRTVPQSILADEPEIARAIERDAPLRDEAGPVRIHRSAVFHPLRWTSESSPARDEEIVAWQKRTAQARMGIPWVAYAMTTGTIEPYDLWWFFAPFYGGDPRSPVVVYPRRGYDLWGARYFVLPGLLVDGDEHRGFRSFLPRTRPIAHSPPDEDEIQVLANASAYPRGWIAHETEAWPPIRGLRSEDRQEPMAAILYAGDDPLWRDPARDPSVRDPRRVVLLEHPDPAYVRSLAEPGVDASRDRVRFTRYEPLLLEVETESPARGVLVLSESHLPGWTAEVDGRPAEILRANRMMRGIPVGAGRHRVVLRYRPSTFTVGLAASLSALSALLLGGAILAVRSTRFGG